MVASQRLLIGGRMFTISRKQLLETMVKNHGLTPAEAEKRLSEGMKSCGLKSDGDKLALPGDPKPLKAQSN